MEGRRDASGHSKWGVSGKSLSRSTLIWIPEQDAESDNVWVKAEVQSSDDKGLKVRLSDSNAVRVIPDAQQVFLCNEEIWSTAAGLSGVQDLSVLMHLHEPEVLQTLHFRFDTDQIYTFCGPILIAVNPFKHIPDLYSDRICRKITKDQTPPPHIFTIAHRALSNLVKGKQPQVILISGESGAGKTETTKHSLKFLSETMGPGSSPSHRDKRTTLEVRQDVADAIKGTSTEQKVLKSNPLLEAFGNACTVRNSNSSRFGKFIELQFDGPAKRLRFTGALIDVYLLEKVRITELQTRERSYHIFYQACAARQRFGPAGLGLPLDYFGPPKSFTYLAKSDLQTLKSMDDAEEFERTQAAMTSLGVSSEEQASILKVVALVLHIGNLSFVGSSDHSEVAPDCKSFEIVCSLLNVRKEVLAKALTHRLISVSSTEQYDSPLPPKQAEEKREALTRVIYGILFDHIVARVNLSLHGTNDDAPTTFIGVLDIFGFENFDKNSFEQLCINFANERLQKLFNDFVFRMEMELYASEEVDYDGSDFPDNQDIIDLIQAKSGIFGLLDEECRLPKGSDQNYCAKIQKVFDRHPRFKPAANRRNSTFQIMHFAGPVTYSSARFMDKNIDELGELLKLTLESSQDPFIQEILVYRDRRRADASKSSSRSGKLKPSTVSFDFKSQLESLMAKLMEASPHFVRCIKPNPQSRAELFSRRAVAEQLRSGGVIEALRVQRAGYPCRVARDVFWNDTLRILLRRDIHVQRKRLELSQRLQISLAELQSEFRLAHGSYAVGKTTVFFKQRTFEILESAKARRINMAATRIQSAFKAHYFSALYSLIRFRFVCLQACTRRFLVRNRVWNNMTPEERCDSLLYARVGRKNVVMQKKQMELAEQERRRVQQEEEKRRLQEETEMRRRKEEEDRQRRLAEEQQERIARAEKTAHEAEARAESLSTEVRDIEKKMDRQRVEAEQQATIFQAREKELEGHVRQLEARAKENNDEKQNLLSKDQALQKRIDVLEARVQELLSQIQQLEAEADVRRAESEQQMSLAQMREKTLNERVRELEGEVSQLQQRLATQSESYEVRLAHEQEAAAHQEILAMEQQEEMRAGYEAKFKELRAALDETQRGQVTALTNQAMETKQQLEDLSKKAQERKEKLKRQHDQALETLKRDQMEQQQKMEADLQDAQQHHGSLVAQTEMLQQQAEQLKAEHAKHCTLLEEQAEETKRVHASQMELLEQRSMDRDASHAQELELMKKQRQQQTSALQAEFENQKQGLLNSCRQEVELVKKQCEERERHVMQMLDDSKLADSEREEKQKALEVQLLLRSQQQEELQRVAESRARHLQDSAARQQELYEQRTAQLGRQLQEGRDNFEQQLETTRLQAAAQLREVTMKMEEMETQYHVERQQEWRLLAEVRAASQEQAAMLIERVKTLKQEAEVLQKERFDDFSKLVDMSRDVRSRSKEKAQASSVWQQPVDSQTNEHIKAFQELTSEIVGLESQFKAERKHQQDILAEAQVALQKKRDAPPDPEDERKQRLRIATQDLTGLPKVNPSRKESDSMASILGHRSSLRNRLEPPTSFPQFLGTSSASTPRQRAQTCGLPVSGVAGRRSLISKDFERSAHMNYFGGSVPIPQRAVKDADRNHVVVHQCANLTVDAAVTVLCFSKPKLAHDPVALAVACQTGCVSVFTVRSKQAHASSKDEALEPELVLQFQAHSRAITSMCFTDDQQDLVTASTDWTLRLWGFQNGRLLQLLEIVDSSIIVCIIPLPQVSRSFVIANHGAVLRLVTDATVRQKVRLDHYIRSFAFGFDNKRLLAGSSHGYIYGFDATVDGLSLSNKLQVSRAAITCLVVIPGASAVGPLLVANIMDSTLCVLRANATFSNFTVLHRLSNPQSLLPLKCCHFSMDVASNLGFIASGSEDSNVRVFDLSSFQEQHVPGHSDVPVVGVAASSDSKLLASGDTRGCVILWRPLAEKTPAGREVEARHA